MAVIIAATFPAVQLSAVANVKPSRQNISLISLLSVLVSTDIIISLINVT